MKDDYKKVKKALINIYLTAKIRKKSDVTHLLTLIKQRQRTSQRKY